VSRLRSTLAHFFRDQSSFTVFSLISETLLNMYTYRYVFVRLFAQVFLGLVFDLFISTQMDAVFFDNFSQT